jgi:preprotein translocase subunit SecA
MDGLREGISLRSYGQRDPLVEYKREAYMLFMDLMDRIYEEIATSMFRSATSAEAIESFFENLSGMQIQHQEVSALDAAMAQQMSSPTATSSGGLGAPPPGMEIPPQAPPPTVVRQGIEKVGRNDPCPCGSGRKYKKCCGKE